MQRQMAILPQPLLLNPLKDSAKVEAVDYSADFQNLYSGVDDFIKLYDEGQLPYNMVRYIPGLTKLTYQGQMDSTEAKRKYADDTYKNKKVIEFNIVLTNNHYTNFQNMHLCFSLKFKSAADNDNDLLAGTVPVNNFFAHWIREINIARYGDDQSILPLINTVDIYRYSDDLLKHMLEKVLKTYRSSLLYSNKKIVLTNENRDKRLNYTNWTNAADKTDANLSE